VSVTLQVRYCRELETWVLGFGEHACVARPERLRETVASRLKKAAARYVAPQQARPSVAKARRAEQAAGKRRAR
jgi:hypothetical protein